MQLESSSFLLLLRTGAILVNKATVVSWKALHSFHEDTPVTKVKVSVIQLQALQNLEDGEQLSEIGAFWNGKEFTVNRLKKVLLQYSAIPEDVLDEESLLNWIGQLPL